ncbi:MAG: ribonuclease P protein component [Planctomyces sp.]
MPSDQPPLRFRRSQRLVHALEFEAVFAQRCSVQRGPLRIHARLAFAPGVTRLGLSIGKRVGIATTRTALKRRLREAFRLEQHALPNGMDLVISAHAHEPRTLPTYRDALRSAAAELHARLTRRPSGPTP